MAKPSLEVKRGPHSDTHWTFSPQRFFTKIHDGYHGHFNQYRVCSKFCFCRIIREAKMEKKYVNGYFQHPNHILLRYQPQLSATRNVAPEGSSGG